MSVVACRIINGKIEIAADSLTARGYTQSKNENVKYAKLVIVNDMIIGGVGLNEEIALMQIFCQTHQPKAPTVDDILTFICEFSDWKKKRTDEHQLENAYILLYKGKAFTIERFLVTEIVTYAAMGAGMDFALAAMYLGSDVTNAVRAACELSIYCEEPIIHFSMEVE